MREFTVNVSPDAPDMFLLDIQSDQVAGVRRCSARYQPAGAAPARLVPVLRARVVGVEGREVQLENFEDVRGRGSLAREYTVTYRPALERNETIVAGAMWDATPSDAGRSLDRAEPQRALPHRRRRHDALRRARPHRSPRRSAASVRVEWSDSRAGGFMFVFRPGLLEKAPHGFIAFLRGPDDADGAGADADASWSAVAPNVSVIDGREMLTAIKTVVDNVTLAVTVVGTLVAVQRAADPDRRRGDDEVPPRLRGRDLQDAGRDPADDCDGAVSRIRRARPLAGAIGAAGAIALTWGISRYRAGDSVSTRCRAERHRRRRHRGAGRRSSACCSSWEVLQHKPLATCAPSEAGTDACHGRAQRLRGTAKTHASTVLDCCDATDSASARPLPGRRSGSASVASASDVACTGPSGVQVGLGAESMNVSAYKDALLKKRAELVETAGLNPLQNSMEHNNGRQGDMADQASGNNEVHIQLRLKQTDAKILQAIDEALMRIEKGAFGLCRDCGEPIAEARLNAIPWTRVCITCKEKQKA